MSANKKIFQSKYRAIYIVCQEKKSQYIVVKFHQSERHIKGYSARLRGLEAGFCNTITHAKIFLSDYR
jgi:hypothetical protein